MTDASRPAAVLRRPGARAGRVAGDGVARTTARSCAVGGNAVTNDEKKLHANLSANLSANLRADLREMAMMQRRLGREEFRIAAARFFEKLKMPWSASEMLGLDIDQYLTPEEIAEREKMP